MGKLARIFSLLVLLGSGVNAQTLRDTLSISVKDLPLNQVLDSITIKTGYSFIYNADLINKSNLYLVTRNQTSLDDLLSYLLTGTNLKYEKDNDQIIITKAGSKRSTTRPFVPGTVISGKVVDAETGHPLEAVNVFINGTTIGTSTDSLGNYAIIADLGVVQIVFSHVEFAGSSISRRISDQNPIRADMKLSRATILLPEVEVSIDPLVPDNSRMRYFNSFRKELLGMSNNSMNCTITNPEIIDFTKTDDPENYEATAPKPVVIINRNLGYKLHTLLENFQKEDNLTTFHVKVRFEELPPPKPKWERYWERNRLKAYKGSKEHFLRSIVSGTCDQEGFVLHRFNSFEELAMNQQVEITGDEIIEYTSNPEEVVLKFDFFLLIEYTRERPDPGFYTQSIEGDIRTTYSHIYGLTDLYHQKSVLRLKNGRLTIERSGLNYNKFAVDVFGYWSWERVGELLPSNYKPGIR